jgi:dipeptidyl aminopeptidase/acylaminoacyl peptidase
MKAMATIRVISTFLCLGLGLGIQPALSSTSSTLPGTPHIEALLSELGKARSFRQTALSPDGQRIAWLQPEDSTPVVTSTANLEEKQKITIGEKGNGTCREGSLAWSPDSHLLAFFSTCSSSEETGLYVTDVTAHAAPRRLLGIKGYVQALSFAPDGRSLGFLYVEGATRPAGALAAMKPPAGVIGEDGLEIQRVAVANVQKGELRQVSPASLHVYEFDWSPDSQQLAYVAAPPPGENNWWVAKLYTQPVEGQPHAILDPVTVSGPLHGLQIAVPRWSPDGKQLAFIGGLMSDQGVTGGDIYLLSAEGGLPHNLTADRPTSAAWINWRDTSHLFVGEHAGGNSRLVQMQISADGAHFDSPVFEEAATVGDGRMNMSVSFSRDHSTFAFLGRSFSQPEEVWLVRDGKRTQVTHENDDLRPSWGKAESITWTNEGFHVQGWLVYPQNYDPSKKYPMIVSVHGGPASAVTPNWPSVGFTPLAFASLGYFVLMPNPRGSYGQGEAFTAANRKDFGYGDLRDILAGMDTVIATHPIDKDRIGLTGWSYGGFMTMFAVTQTQRFKAAVAGAGIANWQSYYGENSIDQWMKPFFGASVYDDPAVYAKSSAINFIGQAKTPTLIVVGDRDGECPAPQSFEFWHALRAASVPTQLVVYPNEGHHFNALDHRRDVLERALEWFQKYMPANGE